MIPRLLAFDRQPGRTIATMGMPFAIADTPSVSPDNQPHGLRAAVVLAVVLGVGLALRLTGVRFGLPAVYNPDEVAIMSRALALAKGDLNPHNFLYPSFFFYVLAGWIGGYVMVALAAGQASLELIQSQFFRDPTHIYLAGRLLGVACGTATIAGTYVFAARVFDRTAGLSAAAFLAVAPTAVRDAHYVKHDVPVTLLTTLALLAIVQLSLARSQKQWRALVIASVLVGAAASTHYYTVFLVVPLTIAICARRRPLGAVVCARELAIAAIICLAAFVLLSPFIVVEWRTALRDVTANRQIVIDRAIIGDRGAFGSLASYLGMLWSDATGWPVAALAIAGVCILAAYSRLDCGLLLSFPIVFLLFLANTVPAARYLNPILPIVVTFAGVAVSRLASGFPRRLSGPIATAVTVSAFLPGLLLSWQTDQLFRQDDTRSLAQRFIETHIPSGSTVLVQPYSAELRPSRESLVETLRSNNIAPGAAPTKVQRQLALNPYPTPSYRVLYLGDGGKDSDKMYVHYSELGRPGLQRLHDLGVQYLVVTRYRTPQPSVSPFLTALANESRLVAVFSPYRADATAEVRHHVEPFLHNTTARPDAHLERPGPVIELWKL